MAEHGKILILQDHPRVCGEKNLTVEAGGSITGSPPRVRGKASKSANITGGSRITPACAGKSLRTLITCDCRQDHPRVCGEKISHISQLNDISRITPACAGKSVGRCNKEVAEQDHPRVCGEKKIQIK